MPLLSGVIILTAPDEAGFVLIPVFFLSNVFEIRKSGVSNPHVVLIFCTRSENFLWAVLSQK